MNHAVHVNGSKPCVVATDTPVGRRRAFFLLGLTAFLSVSSVVINQQPWTGNAELHTMMELLATTIGVFAAILAFLRYYARRNAAFIFLCLGAGLSATAALDAYHGLITSEFVADIDFSSSAHWSWNASRFLFSILMLLCWLAARSDRRRESPPVSDWVIYCGAALFTVLTGFFFTALHFPTAVFPDLLISRPVDLISGSIFLFAVIALVRLKTWKTVSFHFWLICAIILAAVCQLLVMSQSKTMFDAGFDWAHMLKIFSYLAILIGLLIDIFQLHRTVDHVAESLDNANHRLRTSEERFALAAEGSANGLWDWDIQSDQVWYASRFWDLLGYQDISYPPSNVESFNQHLHPDDYQNTWDAVERHLNQGAVFDVVYRLRHRQNGYRWFRARAVAQYSADGTPVRMSGSIQDINDAKLAEKRLERSTFQLQRSNEELQQFAYVASHDLQEPLRAIAGYCSLLQQFHQEKLDEDGKEFVQHAVDGAKRMQALINSLLDLSRVGTHGKPFEPTELSAVFKTAIDNLKAQIDEQDASIQIEEMPRVNGDCDQLIQLFQNLISNAIKFQPEGIQPVIIIRAESQDDQWVLSFQDNGIGIEADYFERIFTVFQRLHTREEYPGTGIGLAICKKVVERHHGQIWLSSAQGEGSTFYFTIPKALDEFQLTSDDQPVQPVH